MKKSKFLAVAATLAVVVAGGTANNANAALSAVGPIGDPVNNGFPNWFADENGLKLQLCLDQDPRGLCILTPGFDPLTPPVTPIGTVASGNFPDESFYAIADANPSPANVRLPGANTDIKITYRAALEQAFLAGLVPGGQAIFLRVQTDINGLVPGATYTVEHPYGTMTVVADAQGGGRTRFEDLVQCNPGFACNFAPILPATQTQVGSFLQWDGTLPAPPAGFIGDPNVGHTVSGGRGGVNSVTVTGTDVGGPGVGSVSTNIFNVAGKLAPAEGTPNTTSVTPATAAIATAATQQLSAAAFDASGFQVINPTFAWSSDNTAVATVDAATGLVTAVAPGTANITADSGIVGIAAGISTITVADPVLTTINLTVPNPNIPVGGAQHILAATLDQFNVPFAATVTWSSSNPAVGTIDPTTGLFMGVSAGTTTVTATSGAITGSATFNVTGNVSPAANTPAGPKTINKAELLALRPDVAARNWTDKLILSWWNNFGKNEMPGFIFAPAGAAGAPPAIGPVGSVDSILSQLSVSDVTRNSFSLIIKTSENTNAEIILSTKRVNVQKNKPNIPHVSDGQSTNERTIVLSGLKRNTNHFWKLRLTKADGSVSETQIFRTKTAR